jgi:allantoin racemase
MKDVLMVLPFLNSSPFILPTRDYYKDIDGVEIVGVDEGKDPVITYSDIEYMMPGILNRIAKAEAEGHPAAVIGCFGDPALAAVRQKVKIPVLGPGETALAVASTLGHKILLLEPSKEFVFPTEEMVAKYGYTDKVVGIHHVEVPLEACCTVFRDQTEATQKLSNEVAQEVCKRVSESGAHVVILGCIGLAGFVDIVNRALGESGYMVPIVEPGAVVMGYAKFLLQLNLNQSREMWRI